MTADRDREALGEDVVDSIENLADRIIYDCDGSVDLAVLVRDRITVFLKKHLAHARAESAELERLVREMRAAQKATDECDFNNHPLGDVLMREIAAEQAVDAWLGEKKP